MTITSIFPGAASGITYSVNPDYYAALVSETTLAAYSFIGAAYADSVLYTAVALGDTGWTWCVYKYSVGDIYHSFAYNATTKEVVRFYDSLSPVNYWPHELVLAAFAETGAASFFDAINKTRNVSLYTAGELTTVDGSVSGWTAYHDALVVELKGLIDKYGWQDSPAIASRVSEIQEELQQIGSTLVDSPLQSLLAEFEAARVEADYANESRYDSLIADVSGTPDATKLMSYTQLAKHISDTYYVTNQTAFSALEDDQYDRDQEVVDAIDAMWTTLSGWLDEVAALITKGGYTQTLDNFWKVKIATYQQTQGARIAAMQLRASNAKDLAIQTLRWRAETAVRMESLYQLAPGVVERRTDIGPSLADVANLTMNVGRGQASQQMMDAFSPTSFIATAGTPSAGLAGFLTDQTKKG